MPRLDDFVQAVQKKTRDEFVKGTPPAFLLLALEPEESTNTDWAFKTTTVASRKINVARILDKSGLTLSKEADRLRVFPLTKSVDNPWQERVSVGRARNNDIVLPHKSVSKLHAHFVTTQEGRVAIVDAGSRNGTRLNDEKLASGKRAFPKNGDNVTFGAVAMTFIDADALYDLVKKHLRPRGPGE
jgi:hypothetical protein